jgi:hypothetical protein
VLCCSRNEQAYCHCYSYRQALWYEDINVDIVKQLLACNQHHRFAARGAVHLTAQYASNKHHMLDTVLKRYYSSYYSPEYSA